MQQIFAYFHLLLVFFAEHLVDLFDLKPCLFDGEIDIAKILDRNAEGRNQADSRTSWPAVIVPEAKLGMLMQTIRTGATELMTRVSVL